MNTKLDYVLSKCFQEKLNSIFALGSHRALTTPRQKSDAMTTSRHAHNLNSIQYNLHFNSEDEYTEALVLTPHNPFRRYPPPKLFQDASQDYVLPLIPIVDSKRVEPQQKSTDPSEPMTTRRNKQMERMRTFSTRYRQVRAGILLIDVDNKQILSLFKRYSNLQASKMDIFLEISKQQLAMYLSNYMGSQAQIIRLLNYLNFPPTITYAAFKQFLLQISDLKHNEIVSAVFHAYDTNQSGYLQISDIFDMFKAGGGATIDGSYIFRSLQAMPKQEASSESPKLVKKPQQTKRKRPVLITMLKEKPQKIQVIKKQPIQFETHIITYLQFQEFFKDKLPEFFKSFVKALNGE